VEWWGAVFAGSGKLPLDPVVQRSIGRESGSPTNLPLAGAQDEQAPALQRSGAKIY